MLAFGKRLDNTGQGGRQEGARFALFLLSVVNLLNFADRYIPASIKELFKHDLKLTDMQTSLPLTGLMAVYIVTAMIVGVLAGREICDRRLILALAVAFWSGMTALSGMAQNFVQFFIFRSLIGVGEGAYMTIVPAMLADFYPPKDRNLVFAMFWVCAPAGGALGFLLGAWLGTEHSWRTALMAIGLPGLLVACCIPCMNDPFRGVNEPIGLLEREDSWYTSVCAVSGDPHERDQCIASGDKNSGLLRCIGKILSVPHWIFALLGKIACDFLLGGLSDWSTTLMVRTFPQEGIKKVGMTMGAIAAVGGILGPIIGSMVVERVQIRCHNAPLLVSSLFMIPCAGFLCVYINMTSIVRMVQLAGWLGWTCLFTFTAIIQVFLVNSIPVRLRALSQALAMTLSTILGEVISPPIIGAISDTTGSLRAGMQLVWIMALVASCVWMAGWLTLPPLPGWETAISQEYVSAGTTQKGSSLHSLLLSNDCHEETNVLRRFGNSYSTVEHAAKTEHTQP